MVAVRATLTLGSWIVAVPAAIEESDRTVGAARTAIKAPVSEYAGALEGIAGQPVASDPTTKFGPALGSLTGDAPPAHGTVPAVVDAGIEVVDAVSTAAATAAATVVHTVKQVCFPPFVCCLTPFQTSPSYTRGPHNLA
jgi:hypothetical protein